MNDQSYNMIRMLALQMIQQLPPERANNPQVQAMIKAIQDNDQEAGQRIASNICKTYNITKEEGVQNALNMFNKK